MREQVVLPAGEGGLRLPEVPEPAAGAVRAQVDAGPDLAGREADDEEGAEATVEAGKLGVLLLQEDPAYFAEQVQVQQIDEGLVHPSSRVFRSLPQVRRLLLRVARLRRSHQPRQDPQRLQAQRPRLPLQTHLQRRLVRQDHRASAGGLPGLDGSGLLQGGGKDQPAMLVRAGVAAAQASSVWGV